MHRQALARCVVAPLLLVALALPAASAEARTFQPDVGAFIFTCPKGATTCTGQDDAGFADFAGQLASAVVSRFPGPIQTLGSHRLEVSYTIGMNELDRDRDYWRGDATVGRKPVVSGDSKLLTVGQIQVRKGLPYSFQLGGTVTQVFGGSLWGVGLELGWTPLEGIRNAPDLGIKLEVGTVLGADDLMMIHTGAALIISKSFGVAGLFSLAPYGGYQFLYASASTHLTGGYRQDQTQPTLFAIDPQNIFLHRIVFGLEALASWVVVGAEMTIEIPTARRSYALKLGAQF